MNSDGLWKVYCKEDKIKFGLSKKQCPTHPPPLKKQNNNNKSKTNKKQQKRQQPTAPTPPLDNCPVKTSILVTVIITLATNSITKLSANDNPARDE